MTLRELITQIGDTEIPPDLPERMDRAAEYMVAVAEGFAIAVWIALIVGMVAFAVVRWRERRKR